MEVLGCTVYGDLPALASRYIVRVRAPNAHGSTSGLDHIVLDCMIDIIHLRKRKASQLANGSLSISQLVKDSLAIEEKLDGSPTKLEIEDSGRSAFSQVFRSAARVFLQCTVSEPRPEIVEIQQRVEETIKALNELPRAPLLKRLAWPICIAASMASKQDHQAFFRTLQDRAKQAWGPDENVCRAMNAAFECWRLRGISSKGQTYDWTDGMKSLGCLWLLF